MNILRICFIFLFLSQALQAQSPRMEVKFSEPLAIFVFVEQCSPIKPENSFRTLFENSKYYTDKYKNLLALFDTLQFNYVYPYEEFPFGSKQAGNTKSILKKNLIASANLKDFKTLSLGTIPNAKLLQLTAILYEFQQVYRELVYQPNKAVFTKQLGALSDFLRTKNLAQYFDKALIFYKSYWEESIPFEMVFYPQPNAKGFSAEAFYNNALSGIPKDLSDYTTLFSIMMHEVYHIFYDEQPLKVKNNLALWFQSNPSKCSVYAYHLLNEVLATGFGNGYVYESLKGKADEDDWYDRKYINLMAKKIYPVLHDYISQGKAIDQDFVNTYLKIYEENYSGWLLEFDNLMCYRSVISDDKRYNQLLAKNYSYSSLSQFEDEINENSLERLKNMALTKMILLSKNNEAQLKLIKNKFSELKSWKYKAKQDFLYAVFLEDKTQLIIVNSVKQSVDQILQGRVLLPSK